MHNDQAQGEGCSLYPGGEGGNSPQARTDKHEEESQESSQSSRGKKKLV